MEISLTSGRIFRRTNQSGIGLLGVVEVPAVLETEGMHRCIIQAGAVFVDRIEAFGLRDSLGEVCDLEVMKEESANSFFYRRYASGADGLQEFFFREAVLPPSTPGMKWCYITGSRRLELPQISEDGMYELGSQLRKIELPVNFGVGVELGGLLREPVWGPAGAYGLGHTLEVGFFPKWVETHRAYTARQDPRFARFMEAMAVHGDAPLFYTAAQREEREALCDKVIRELMAEEDSPRPRG